MQIVGIGSEIVECLRIAQMIERHGELFIGRLFTDHEMTFCSSRKTATQHFAAFWAGKEAVAKAIGTGPRRGFHWTDIEIRQPLQEPPTVAFRGTARDLIAESHIEQVMLSMSHCRSHATAYAIAVSGAR